MSRPKGSTNKVSVQTPTECSLTPEERLEFIANLMLDRIVADQSGNKKLLRKIKRQSGARLSYN